MVQHRALEQAPELAVPPVATCSGFAAGAPASRGDLGEEGGLAEGGRGEQML